MEILARGRSLLTQYFFIVKYAISGLTGGLVQVGVLYVWVDLLGLKDRYLVGVVSAFCIAVVITFLLQKYWTFSDTGTKRIHAQFLWYVFAALVNLGLSLLLSAASRAVFESLQFDYFHGWYLLVQFCIIFIVAAASFAINFLVTFKGTLGRTASSAPSQGMV